MKPSRITDLNKLHWKFRNQVVKLLKACNERVKGNVEFCVFESVRSNELQEYYYDQGRKRAGQIITNVKTPTFHNANVGLAVDIVPKVNGNFTWSRKDLFEIIGQEAVKLGLTWGGNWKSFYDGPHVQMDDGLSSLDIRNGKRPSWFNDANPSEFEKDYTGHWAEKGIDYCLENGIMKGYGDGKFHPDEPLTRAQHAWMKYQEAIKKGEV